MTGWTSGLVVYALIWWVVLFAVLPWGIRVPDRQEPGHASSAPANPRLWQKALVTTAIAGVIWGAVYYLMRSGWIDLRPPAAS